MADNLLTGRNLIKQSEEMIRAQDDLLFKQGGRPISQENLKTHLQQVFKIGGSEYDTSQFGVGEAKILRGRQLQAHLAKTFAGTAAEQAIHLFYQQFVLLNSKGKPMPGIYYTAEFASAKLRHGTTDRAGHTEIYTTKNKEEIKIYAGHNTKDMTERYLIGKGSTDKRESLPMALKCEKYAPAEMKISSQGKDFIKGWEGIKTNPERTISFYYHDDVGYCTVGWGELTRGLSDCESQNKKGIAKGKHYRAGDEKRYDYITIEEANKLFDSSVKIKSESVVNRAIKSPLSQNEFDALCSLIFNIGSFIKTPKLLKLINRGDYINGPNEILDIGKAKGKFLTGLNTRREREYEIFISNTYNSSH